MKSNICGKCGRKNNVYFLYCYACNTHFPDEVVMKESKPDVVGDVAQGIKKQQWDQMGYEGGVIFSVLIGGVVGWYLGPVLGIVVAVLLGFVSVCLYFKR